MDLVFLKKIRLIEAGQALRHFSGGMRLLELGAGAGWQSKFFSDQGYQVEAIDLPQSNYSNVRDWPITDYDGVSIPFPDATFDIVFTSNVLEHIVHQDRILAEVKRVLRPGGLCLHIVPTTSWRFWTYLSHYPAVIIEVMRRAKSVKLDKSNSNHQYRSTRTFAEKLWRLAFSPRHGDHGSALSELFLFSGKSWKQLIESSGVVAVEVEPLRLFYSGHCLFGERLSTDIRRILSVFVGSSTLLLKGMRPE